MRFGTSRPSTGLECFDPKGWARALLRLVHQRYIPNKIVLLADGGAGQRQLSSWLPFLTGVTRKQGRATAYICENYVCKLPTTDPRVVARLLDSKS